MPAALPVAGLPSPGHRGSGKSVPPHRRSRRETASADATHWPQSPELSAFRVILLSHLLQLLSAVIQSNSLDSIFTKISRLLFSSEPKHFHSAALLWDLRGLCLSSLISALPRPVPHQQLSTPILLLRQAALSPRPASLSLQDFLRVPI